MADLLSGLVHLMFEPASTSVAHIREGKLRPLGITSAARSVALPDIPAIAEFLPGYEVIGWIGIGAPRNTPVEIVDRLTWRLL